MGTHPPSYNDSVNGNWDMTSGYDTLNRLVGAHVTSGTYSGKYFCWAYDAFGNRTAQVMQTSACSSGTITATASYNAKNQVTWVQNTATNGFTYDASGNVTADANNQYLYDGEGHICAVRSESIAGIYTMTGYIYDADGTRVAKGSISTLSCDLATNGFQTQNDYILGLGGEQMTEMTMDSDASMYVAHNNVWAGGKLQATYDAGGDLHFYLTDPLGSRRVMTNYAGIVEQNCQNLPYGDGENCGPTPTEHLFTGKERDSESGNDYFGARYYASSMGRWLSPDWSAKEDPIPYAKLDDPQSLNLYAYVWNNPLGRTDADGHCYPFCDIAIWIATHVAQVGTGISSTRNEYNARAQQATTPAQRDALKLEMREKGPALGRTLAQQAANDPARVAARAAKTDAQLAETVGKTNAGVNALAEHAGTLGKASTVLAVAGAAYNVATAPDGQKAQTAVNEGSGLGRIDIYTFQLSF